MANSRSIEKKGELLALGRDGFQALYDRLGSKGISELYLLHHQSVLNVALELGAIVKCSRTLRSLIDLTEHQRMVVCGTLLGDSCMRPRKLGASFELCHGAEQVDYLLWKIGELRDFPHGKLETYSKGEHVYHKMYFHTQPSFEPIYKDFYTGPGGKKVIRARHVSALDEEGMAIWFADDGHIDDGSVSQRKPDRAYFHIGYSYTSEQMEILAIFRDRYGDVSLNKGKTTWRFVFSTAATQRLAKQVNPYLRDFLPEKVFREKL